MSASRPQKAGLWSRVKSSLQYAAQNPLKVFFAALPFVAQLFPKTNAISIKYNRGNDLIVELGDALISRQKFAEWNPDLPPRRLADEYREQLRSSLQQAIIYDRVADVAKIAEFADEQDREIFSMPLIVAPAYQASNYYKNRELAPIFLTVPAGARKVLQHLIEHSNEYEIDPHAKNSQPISGWSISNYGVLAHACAMEVIPIINYLVSIGHYEADITNECLRVALLNKKERVFSTLNATGVDLNLHHRSGVEVADLSDYVIYRNIPETIYTLLRYNISLNQNGDNEGLLEFLISTSTNRHTTQVLAIAGVMEATLLTAINILLNSRQVNFYERALRSSVVDREVDSIIAHAINSMRWDIVNKMLIKGYDISWRGASGYDFIDHLTAWEIKSKKKKKIT